MTTALCLAREGFRVTVLAEKFAPDIVSVVAGALWEWPPAVCGYHHDQISLARSKEWCVTSYGIFEELARANVPGVAMRRSNFYFKHPVEENPQDLNKMQELAGKVRGFVRDRSLAERNGIDPDYGVVDAYSHLAPMIDTDQYMMWLMREVEAHGVQVKRYRIEGLLADRRAELLDRFDAEAIVCCAGLGTAQLRGIDMYPLRGALVRVRNDGIRGCRIGEAHCVSHNEGSNEQDIVFIVPRSERILVLGGLAEKDEWGTDINLDNHGPVREMYERCLAFMPALRNAELDPDEPVRVGLRPFRRENVCLEWDETEQIIYNFAHGGAGFSFSWGCAQEAVGLVRSAVEDRTYSYSF
ncbi:D-amino-acid oxidase [Streptosporangium lutulentum]|uniref:D-amino-acid oxidase n=1 Tax=Streptosporangium lutulentum TaxID=1461250 RepID=A0ABT9QQM2_9ACTN|nr:D-amino-acid oxidase [Streptosporangium lutulentum]